MIILYNTHRCFTDKVNFYITSTLNFAVQDNDMLKNNFYLKGTTSNIIRIFSCINYIICLLLFLICQRSK